MGVRYAVRVNGMTALAMTKLDVLDNLDELRICTGYRCGDEVLSDPPPTIGELSSCEPVYETMPGWAGSGRTAGVTVERDLPIAARAYLERLETLSGAPIAIISTGSDRGDTIVRRDSPVGRSLHVCAADHVR